MSNLQQIFGNGLDISCIEPQGDFDVLPPGKYCVQIEKSEVKQTKKGDGHYLELAMTILDGPSKNRKLWDRINIQNPSQKCVEIGLRQLSALGRACSVTIVSSEDQFLGKVCVAHVKVKDERNEIRTYSATQQLPRSLPLPAQSSQLPGPNVLLDNQSTSPKPPWAR